MAGKPPDKKEKEPPNEVHQNAIWRETVAKEQRHQKLYTHFLFNPFKEREYNINRESAAQDLGQL